MVEDAIAGGRRSRVRRKDLSRPDVMMLGLRSVEAGQGGVERHVDRLAGELDALGYRVEIVVRKPYQQESGRRGKGTRITPLPSPRHVALEAIVHSLIGVLYAAIRRPAVLHIHAIGPSVVVPLARLLGLYVVTTHHGEDYRREKWGPFARFILRFGEYCQAKFSNRRICVSRSLSERLSASYGADFNYVPNGVEATGGADDLDVLAAFSLEPGRYILNVSRLVPEKRHPDLVRAFNRLSLPGYKLVLVGGADHESAYSEDLRRLASTTPNVVMTGFQSGTALASIYRHAGLFALPSTHEGMPIALLEAMSYGLRVVVSDIEANLDLKLPPHVYHKVEDVEDLATVLSAAVHTPAPDWSEEMDQYQWSKIAGETIAAYRVVT